MSNYMPVPEPERRKDDKNTRLPPSSVQLFMGTMKSATSDMRIISIGIRGSFEHLVKNLVNLESNGEYAYVIGLSPEEARAFGNTLLETADKIEDREQGGDR